MKLVLILACLIIYNVVQTRSTNCWGRPLRQSCYDVKDKGYSNRTRCKGNSNNRMWYYDQNKHSCGVLHFQGCGGNNNRFCSKNECDAKCAV